jgi:hypothetical protein
LVIAEGIASGCHKSQIAERLLIPAYLIDDTP